MSPRVPFLLFLAAAAILSTACPVAAQVVSTFESDVSTPWGVEFDAEGNLHVSGRVGDSGFVRRFPADGGPATTISGMTFPTGLAISASGDLFVADTGGVGPSRIWRITPAGVKTLFAQVSAIDNPAFLEFDPAGNLLISDRTQRRMYSLTPSGVGGAYGPGLGELGEWGGQFVVDPSGVVHIGVGPYIKRIGPGGSPVTIVASGLGSVQGLVRGPEGDFIITRNNSSDLWRVSAGGVATPWAGGTVGCVDGILGDAKFGGPQGLAMYESRLFVADRSCNSVRVIETPTPVHETSWGRVKSTYR